uniref:Small ribosomal subunit protein uS8c n=1 Tax=Cyathodium smaragdinum TaxID=2846787 RepID=A0A8F2XVK0_9MARC|nr:ribosomal protein S8 [Cyathodium smaragdinum]
MTNDIIASMVTSIRNANLKKLKTVRIPVTNMSKNIAKILFKEGFIDNFIEEKENNKNVLFLNSKFRGKKKKSYITTLRRISKPGSRIYSNHKEIPKILGGMGIVIISTSRGIMTDREARQQKLGGELSCCIW